MIYYIRKSSNEVIMEEQEKRSHSEEEESETPSSLNEEKKHSKAVEFLADVLRGVMIGIAFIIPGFSGGSVAAILGIYEKLVGAIADLFRQFKKSILVLLPIFLGMILGIAALIYPIQLGLKHFPIPTVCLFVGLAVGGLPSVTEKIKGKISWKHIVACIIPLAVAACLMFLPTAQQEEGFLFHLSFGGYLLLVLIGIVGSAALVVPGISGSMLLLIFGYYNPLVQMVTQSLLHGEQVGVCIAVLACTGMGLIIGFFGISVIMKYLLKKFPHGTYFAILGFIVGSIPTVFYKTAQEANLTFATLPTSPVYWIAAVLLLLFGIALSYGFLVIARKKEKEKRQIQQSTEQ